MAEPERSADPQPRAEPEAPPPGAGADVDASTQPDARAAPDGEPPPGSDLEAVIADLTDRLRRALADADNLRKRAQRQAEEAASMERARVAAAWLTIVDDLERALAHAEPDDPVAAGVEVARDHAVALLDSLGYPRHDETGVEFDPQLHEAVSVREGDGAEAGTVLAVVRPGYGTGAQQLRPAAVVVAG